MRLAVATVAIAAIGLTPVPPAQRPVIPLEGTASIRGRVIDGITGRPVVNAVVGINLRSDSQTRPLVLSAADGTFVLDKLPAGEATLFAQKSGFQRGEHGRLRLGGQGTSIQLAANTRVSDAIIKIWELGLVSGRVLDESNQPVRRIGVRALPRRSSEPLAFDSNFMEVLTDDLGQYEIETLPGQYAIGVVMTPRTSPATGLVQSALAHGEAVIMTAPPSALSAITSPDGGWWHQLENAPTLPLQTAAGHVLTYVSTFFPSVTSLASASIVNVEPATGRSGVDIQLHRVRGYSVSGTVTMPTRTNIGAAVTLHRQPVDPRTGSQESGGRVRGDGAFSLAGVTSGRYTLAFHRVITGPDLRANDTIPLFADVPIVVADRDITGLVVTMREAARVSGKLEFDEPPQPTEDLNVALINVDGGRDADVRHSLRGFDFTVRSVTPARYLLQASGGAWRIATATLAGRDLLLEPFDVGTTDISGIVIHLTKQMTRVTGVVRTSSGETTRDAQVVLFPSNRAAWSFAEFNRRFVAWRPQPGGVYLIGGLPAGEYFVAAVAEAEMDRWPSPRFLEGIAATATRVQLVPGVPQTLDLRVGAR